MINILGAAKKTLAPQVLYRSMTFQLMRPFVYFDILSNATVLLLWQLVIYCEFIVFLK